MGKPDSDRVDGPPRGSGRYIGGGHGWWMTAGNVGSGPPLTWMSSSDMDVLEVEMKDAAAHRWSAAS